MHLRNQTGGKRHRVVLTSATAHSGHWLRHLGFRVRLPAATYGST